MREPFYIQIEDERYRLRSNDVLLIPPYLKMSGYEMSKDPVGFYWLHFFINKEPRLLKKDELMNELAPLATKSYAPSINNQVILPRCFHLNDPGRIFILINQLLDVANSYRYSEQENDYLITAFLIELSNHYLTQIVADQQYKNHKIDKIKEWIRVNITDSLKVEQVAQAFQLNPDYLTRLFKQNEHRTTLQYINDLKIETAQTLLVRTNLLITQIAAHSYFVDDKNFMRRFKMKTGLTPTEYRNANTHTHLNNPQVDPSIPLPKQLEQRMHTKSE